MSWTHRHLKQDFTYWAPSSLNYDAQGFPLPEAPILLKGHLTRTSDLVRNSSGQEIKVTYKIFTTQLCREGGFILEGNNLDKLSPPANAQEIMSYRESNDLRNVCKEHVVYT